MASRTASASSVLSEPSPAGDDDAVGTVEATPAADDLDALLLQATGDVVGLVLGELLDPGVHPLQVDVDAGRGPGSP